MISAADYPGVNFDPGNVVDMNHLQALEVALEKAVSAGYGTDSSGFTGGRSIVVESLERQVQDTLWGEDHIVLFKALRSSALKSTVDEWTRRSLYGSEFGLAVGETANPPMHNSTLDRQVDTVSYYRSRRAVSQVMTLLNTVDPGAEAIEESSAITQILGSVERDLFTGDRTVFPARIKGLQSHILAEGGDLVQDAHGLPVNTQTLFHTLAGIIYNEGGMLTDVYLNPLCQSDITAALSSAERIFVPTQEADGKITVGAAQTALATDYGVLNFEKDRFVRAGWTMLAPDVVDGPDATLIPGTTVIDSAVGSGGAIADQANLPAGDYYVRVSSVCENGESVAAAAEAVTLTATKAIVVTVTPADGVNTGYRVYLSAVDAADGTDCRFQFEVAAAGGQQAITIDGTWVTGSTSLFLLSAGPNQAALDWRQLLPMTKQPLAITDPTFPFLVNLYGYLRVIRPNWMAVIRNVIPSNVPDWDPLGLAV